MNLEDRNLTELLQETRPIAIQIAQEIAEIANSSSSNPAQYGGLIASLVFQNIVGTFAISQFKAGSPDGEAFIRAMYDAALQDAVERWTKKDLKAYQKWEQDHKNKS